MPKVRAAKMNEGSSKVRVERESSHSTRLTVRDQGKDYVIIVPSEPLVSHDSDD